MPDWIHRRVRARRTAWNWSVNKDKAILAQRAKEVVSRMTAATATVFTATTIIYVRACLRHADIACIGPGLPQLELDRELKAALRGDALMDNELRHPSIPMPLLIPPACTTLLLMPLSSNAPIHTTRIPMLLLIPSRRMRLV